MSAVPGMTPATDWREDVPHDEPQRFAGYVRDLRAAQRRAARRARGQVQRGFHTKPHAGLRGAFTVLPDIPPHAKHGLFEAARAFPAWARFSSSFSRPQPDAIPDVRGLAVKVLGVDGDKLLPGEEEARTQDFLAINQPVQPARDADEFVVLALASANLSTALPRIVRALGLSRAAEIMQYAASHLTRPVRSLAEESYWSNAPIRLGPYAVKFLWRARAGRSDAPAAVLDEDYLRHELRSRLAREDVVFDFLVQFFVDAERTPIEDGSVEWKVEHAPFVKVAELVLHQRDLDSEHARREEDYVQRLSFTPWHTSEAHRPLGSIQRVRRVAYLSSAELRGHVKETDVSDSVG